MHVFLFHILHLSFFPSYHDPVRVHNGMQSVCYGQHSTLPELVSDGLLNKTVSSEGRKEMLLKQKEQKKSLCINLGFYMQIVAKIFPQKGILVGLF